MNDKIIKFPERLTIPCDDKLVAKIDREWHRRRLPSRSATIRKLLEEALEKGK